MTTRDEELRTIAQTRDFLFFLLHAKAKEIKPIRKRALQLLKHYPILPLTKKIDLIPWALLGLDEPNLRAGD